MHISNVLAQVALRREGSLAVVVRTHIGPLSSVDSLVSFEAGQACVGLLTTWIIALVGSALALPDLSSSIKGHLVASSEAWIV